MYIKSVNEIIAEIKKEYDEDPRNWRVLRGKDSKGHYDTYISGPKSLWQMKTEWKTPYRPVGVGVKVMGESNEIVKFIMDKGEYFPFGEIYPQIKNSAIIAVGFGKYSQKSTNQLKSVISSKQEKLEKELNKSLDRLLEKEGLFKEFA